VTKLITLIVVCVLTLGLVAFVFGTNLGPAIVTAVTSVKASITDAF